MGCLKYVKSESLLVCVCLKFRTLVGVGYSSLLLYMTIGYILYCHEHPMERVRIYRACFPVYPPPHILTFSCMHTVIFILADLLSPAAHTHLCPCQQTSKSPSVLKQYSNETTRMYFIHLLSVHYESNIVTSRSKNSDTI